MLSDDCMCHCVPLNNTKIIISTLRGPGIWLSLSLQPVDYAMISIVLEDGISRSARCSHNPKFNVFFVFFFVCWKYWKVPLHLELLAKWEVVSPNSRYRAFYHEIGNIQKCPFTYWLNGGGGGEGRIVDIHVGNFNMKLTGRWFPQIVGRDSGNLYPIYI